MLRLRILALLSTVVLSASSAGAQNALSNPDFDANVVGWDALLGAIDLDPLHEDADACPESWSGRLVAAKQPGPAFLGAVRATGSCLDVVPLQEIWIDATLWLRATGFVAADLKVVEYTDDACTSFLDPPAQPVVSLSLDADPAAQHLSIETSAGAESVRLDFETGALVPHALLLDRLYLGLAERIFADDFEGGSTCRWSSAPI